MPRSGWRDPRRVKEARQFRDVGGLLRRRLHADLSRPDVQGLWLSRVRRAPRPRPRRRRGSIRRCARPRPSSMRLRATSTIRRSFIAIPRRSSKQWAAAVPGVESCAVEVYDEWASNHHFEMYDDVPDVLKAIDARGIRIGLISNSHRCLATFQSHFELDGLVAAAISSSNHGYLKPHPSIFEAALRLMNVPAAESVMVGDSVGQDIAGARGIGMRAVLVRRGVRRPAVRRRREPGGSGDSQPARPASAALTAMRTIQPLTTLQQFRQVEQLEAAIWGPVDLVPVPILAVTVRRGAVLLGAYDADRLVGFVFSLAALRQGSDGLRVLLTGRTCSASIRSLRGSGLGADLKLAQRDAVLDLGLDLIEWTFDPLQSINAHLNFAKLGAVARSTSRTFTANRPARCTAGCRPIDSSANGGSAARMSFDASPRRRSAPSTRLRPRRHWSIEHKRWGSRWRQTASIWIGTNRGSRSRSRSTFREC